MLTLLLAAAQVAMTTPSPVAPALDAFPRIARPATPAAKRINLAVTRLDARAKAAAAECRADGGPGRSSWERAVSVTMRGPEFVSFLVTDDVYCGGAHPSNSHSAIVYDLATGRPVDWAKLLPPRLVGEQALTTGADGVEVVTLASARLGQLYAAGYRAALGDDEMWRECEGVEASEEPRAMLAWLDAKRRGLMLQFDLNHAMQACAAPVLVPLDTLRREGASPRLIAALAAAR